jgi:hypothetical protein
MQLLQHGGNVTDGFAKPVRLRGHIKQRSFLKLKKADYDINCLYLRANIARMMHFTKTGVEPYSYDG